MRSIYCILLLSWPIIACAETGDSLIYRHGFLIEFDNATINQVGYRYRLTDVSRLAVRLHFGYEKYRNDNAAINNSELYSYEGTVGFERDIYKSGSATLFLSIGIKYMGSHSTDVTWTQAPEAQTITGKGAAIG